MMIYKMWTMKACNPVLAAYLSCSAKSDSANSPNTKELLYEAYF
ncbi:MAG: hypothetical protein WC944_03530 [Candidatus Cloacimonadaceae bacterium]